MSTFAYEQAERKHRTGQKLTEPEWEALLAGERAAREALEGVQAELDERDAEIEKLEARIGELESGLDERDEDVHDLQREVERLEDAVDDLKASLAGV